MKNQYTKKQLEILEITIDYISKNGIQSFSLRNIADEIGIKQPTLYGHFRNKEEILRGVFNLYKSDITQYHNSLKKLKASKLTKIKMYFFKNCEFIQYKPDYMKLVLFELYQHKDLFRDDFNCILNSITTIIDNAPDDSDVKTEVDYKWLITMLQGMLHVYLKNKLLSPDFDVLSNADKCWHNLEKLLKKSK